MMGRVVRVFGLCGILSRVWGGDMPPEGKAEPVRSLLYEIPGDKPAYLFGTMHVMTREEAAAFRPVLDEVSRVLAGTDIVCREGDGAPGLLEEALADDGAFARFPPEKRDLLAPARKFLFLPDGNVLEGTLPPALLARLKRVRAAHGLPDGIGRQRYQAWFAGLMTMRQAIAGKGGVSMEDHFEALIAQGKKRVVPLDPPLTELLGAVFGPLDAAQQAEWLSGLLDRLEREGRDLKEKTAYFSFDLDTAARLDAGTFLLRGEESPAWQKAFKTRIIDDRNREWLRRIRPLVGKERILVLGGASHIGGPAGLVALLRAEGHDVRPLPLPDASVR